MREVAELWAWMATEADGGRYIIGAEILGAGTGPTPLVTSRKATLELPQVVEMVEGHGRMHNEPIALVHFVEVIG